VPKVWSCDVPGRPRQHDRVVGVAVAEAAERHTNERSSFATLPSGAPCEFARGPREGCERPHSERECGYHVSAARQRRATVPERERRLTGALVRSSEIPESFEGSLATGSTNA